MNTPCEIREERISLLKHTLMPLYAELIDSVKGFIEDNTYFSCIQWGEEFPFSTNEGILFYGRAANTTDGDYDLDAKSMFCSDERIFNREDQMKWALNYNEKFVELIKLVSSHYYPHNKWNENIAWSNIAKVSNGVQVPSGKYWASQYETDNKILLAEMNILSPKVVVMITGWNRNRTYCCIYDDDPNPLEEKTWYCGNNFSCKSAAFIQDGFLYIVTDRPDARDESQNHIIEHANCIIELIDKYSYLVSEK